MEDWFEKRLAEQKALETRDSRVHEEASRVHGELWKEIVRVASEAKAIHFHDLIIQPDEIILPAEPQPGQTATGPRTLRLDLKKDRSELVAHGDSFGTFSLPLDMNGHHVQPKYEGTFLDIPQATRLILDIFFFPELKREDVKSFAAKLNFQFLG